MLKAHSRLFEHLALVTDLVLIALCWIAAYVIRFNVFGRGDIPPFSDYTLQLLPILVVWFIAYKAFDLYRPNRLGSHLSEWFDIAKASTLGVLVLVAGMTFLFHGYEYSRLVILMFWVASIVAVSLSRAAFRELLRFAHRRGYNQRHAVVVGGRLAAADHDRVALVVAAAVGEAQELPERRPRQADGDDRRHPEHQDDETPSSTCASRHCTAGTRC